MLYAVSCVVREYITRVRVDAVRGERGGGGGGPHGDGHGGLQRRAQRGLRADTAYGRAPGPGGEGGSLVLRHTVTENTYRITL